LQDKFEAFNAFKNFKTHVENEVERTILNSLYKSWWRILFKRVSRFLWWTWNSKTLDCSIHTTTKWNIGEKKSNHSEYGEMHIDKYESSEEFLARSCEMEHSYFES
jgi:hypothetical protein